MYHVCVCVCVDSISGSGVYYVEDDISGTAAFLQFFRCLILLIESPNRKLLNGHSVVPAEHG